MQTVSWIEADVPAQLQVHQVYGFIFDINGRILVQEDEGRHNLPGGKPEERENFVETLIREAVEESQVIIKWVNYLGYQHIHGEEEFAQVRYAALLERLLPAAPDPASGRQYGRLWVPPTVVNALLSWSESGTLQVEAAVRVMRDIGIIWNGAPQVNADME